MDYTYTVGMQTPDGVRTHRDTGRYPADTGRGRPAAGVAMRTASRDLARAVPGAELFLPWQNVRLTMHGRTTVRSGWKRNHPINTPVPVVVIAHPVSAGIADVERAIADALTFTTTEGSNNE